MNIAAPSPPLSAPMGAAGFTSRVFVESRAVHSSSGGGGGGVPGGETSSPPPEWNLPVSLDEYVALGPRYRHQRQRQQQRHEDWLTEAAGLAASLGIDPPTSVEAQHRRVFHLYLPVYFWLKELLAVSRRRQSSTSPSPSPSPSPRHCARAPAPSAPFGLEPPLVESAGGRAHSPPLVVGISAPQGCGKTTLVSEMKRMLENDGYSCVVVSIDDFYLTGAEQDALAARYPANPLLQVRGNAGTHDLPLALRTIRLLSSFHGGEEAAPASAAGDVGGEGIQKRREAVVSVPRYNKSAREGKGDRAPESEWSLVSKPPDIVLLEGWMLGFEALQEGSPLLAAAEQVEDGTQVGGLGLVNTFLKDYQELHDQVDAWLILKTADPGMVFEWRAEAERRMREAGQPGMSDEQVRDFCSRYMPAYRAYLPGLYGRSGCRADDDPGAGEPGVVGNDPANDAVEGGKSAGVQKTLTIEVGRDRNPVL
eukprot:g13713.t1